MSCCKNKGGAQRPSRSNAGATPMYPGANRPSRTNAGATPMYPGANNAQRQSNVGQTPFPGAVARRSKAAQRKKIEIHVFQDTDDGGEEWVPLDQSSPSRIPEQEVAGEYLQAMTPAPCSPCSGSGGYQDPNLMNFPDTPTTRQPYYQEDSGEATQYYGSPEEGEDDWQGSGYSSGNYSPATPDSLAGPYDPQDPWWIQNRIMYGNERRGPNTSPMFANNNTEDSFSSSPCFSPQSGYYSDSDESDGIIQPRRLVFDEDEEDLPPPSQLENDICQRSDDLNRNPEVNISFNPLSGGVTLNLPTNQTCRR